MISQSFICSFYKVRGRTSCGVGGRGSTKEVDVHFQKYAIKNGYLPDLKPLSVCMLHGLGINAAMKRVN